MATNTFDRRLVLDEKSTKTLFDLLDSRTDNISNDIKPITQNDVDRSEKLLAQLISHLKH